MKFYDLLKLSLDNLRRRKLRTSLTLLGVIIGTASIVSMLSIALGQTRAMEQMIAGSSELTTIKVMNPDVYGGYMPGQEQVDNSDDSTKLNQATLDGFKSIPHVKYVSPVLSISVSLKQGSYENYAELQGISLEALKAKNLFIIEGQMPDFSQSSQGLQIIVGSDIVNGFWNPNSQNYEPAQVDLINENVFMSIQNYLEDTESQPKKYLMKAAGIIGTEDPYSWSPDLYSMYTEISQLENFLRMNFKGKAWPGQPASKTGKALGEIIYNSVIMGTDDIKYTKDILVHLRDQGFMVESNIEYIDSMRKQAMTQQLVLGGIGGISLLVAAIGIANTMMMSVYERTKEIGIFKVLGCSLKTIRNMFLTEAALIGFIGGLIGIIFSFGISQIINQFSGQIIGDPSTNLSYIPIWLVTGAIAFAMLIGILAGVLPAKRAMNLSALEAIRN